MFEGSGVALVTPFKNGKIDESSFCKLIEEQISSGTDFLVPCGTTGESATLTHQEHDRVVQLAVETAGGRVKVLAGAGSNSTEEAVRLTRQAQSSGADGTLHINPYYNKPSQEGLIRHFETIAEKVDFPLILYNIPGRTGINMTPETMSRLAKVDCILGVKEASGSLEQVSRIIEICPQEFMVLSGEDGLTFPMMALGAKGAISVTANLVPKLCAEMFATIQKGDWEKARNIHYQLAPLNRVLFIETNPTPVKTALAMMKKIEEGVRLPLAPLMDANRQKLKDVLKTCKLL